MILFLLSFIYITSGLGSITFLIVGVFFFSFFLKTFTFVLCHILLLFCVQTLFYLYIYIYKMYIYFCVIRIGLRMLWLVFFWRSIFCWFFFKFLVEIQIITPRLLVFFCLLQYNFYFYLFIQLCAFAFYKDKMYVSKVFSKDFIFIL